MLERYRAARASQSSGLSQPHHTAGGAVPSAAAKQLQSIKQEQGDQKALLPGLGSSAGGGGSAAVSPAADSPVRRSTRTRYTSVRVGGRGKSAGPSDDMDVDGGSNGATGSGGAGTGKKEADGGNGSAGAGNEKEKDGRPGEGQEEEEEEEEEGAQEVDGEDVGRPVLVSPFRGVRD